MNRIFQNQGKKRSNSGAIASIFNAEIDGFCRNISEILKQKWYNMDIQLIFLPEPLDENTIKGYYIGVQNGGENDYIYTIKINFKSKTLIEKRGKLLKNDICQLDFMPFDELNNNPEFIFDFWVVDEEITGNKQNAFCKVKPKQFFAKKVFLDSIQREVISYKLQPTKSNVKKEETDLTSYTRENIKPKASKPNFVYSSDKLDLHSRIEFVNEIDLHLENLTKNSKKMSNGEKLQIQLNAASDFVSEALKVGVSKVYLIHGIGKGKLKERIHDLLHCHPKVKTFKNEYHHKYGFGATEVIFRN